MFVVLSGLIWILNLLIVIGFYIYLVIILILKVI